MVQRGTGAEDCRELKPKGGSFPPALGSAAPMSVVALAEVMGDLSPRGAGREAAGCESLLPAKENPEERSSSFTSQHPQALCGLSIRAAEK